MTKHPYGFWDTVLGRVGPDRWEPMRYIGMTPHGSLIAIQTKPHRCQQVWYLQPYDMRRQGEVIDASGVVRRLVTGRMPYVGPTDEEIANDA